MELSQLKAVIEALVFASPEPLTPRMLYRLLNDEPKEDVQAALKAVQADYVDRGGLHIAEVAGGFQITTRPEYHEWVRRLFHERSAAKLSVAALETLSVIAYKQPVTAAEIGEIRSVNTSGVLSTLLERHLIKIVGRKNVIGRPFLYGTTKEFLIRFGLNDLNDLPKIEDMAQQLGFEPPPILMERPVPEEMLPLEEGDVPEGSMPRNWSGTFVRNSSDCVREQRVDAVRVHEFLARRPLEDREPAVLRRHQRDGVALIVHELRRRQMPRAAELRGRGPRRHAAFNGLGDVHQFHRRAAALARDLRAKRQQVVAIVDDRRAVHRGQSGNHIHGALEVIRVGGARARQVGQLRMRRFDRIQHRRHDRFEPLAGIRRHDQQRAAAPVLPHRRRQLHEHRGQSRSAGAIPGPHERGHHGGAVGDHLAGLLVDDLDLIAFEDRDVHELAERLGAVLDDDAVPR